MHTNFNFFRVNIEHCSIILIYLFSYVFEYHDQYINKLGLSWAKLSLNWGLKLECECEVGNWKFGKWKLEFEISEFENSEFESFECSNLEFETLKFENSEF